MNIPATFRSEHSWNVQIWHYINIKLRYFLFHENWTVTKCFHYTDHFKCSDKIQNPNDSFSIQLWTFYEHSHLNIHTIFILNYERIIFECSPKHSRNVPWMLPCPLGVISSIRVNLPEAYATFMALIIAVCCVVKTSPVSVTILFLRVACVKTLKVRPAEVSWLVIAAFGGARTSQLSRYIPLDLIT